MNLTRILLSVEHQLHAQLLKNFLVSRNDVEVVGETKGLVDSLMLIAAQKPDLWIHSWDEDVESSAALSHALSLHPDLLVCRVDPDEPAGLMQFQIHSMPQLMDIVTRARSPFSRPQLEAAGDVP